MSNPVLIEGQKTRRMLQPLLREKKEKVRTTWRFQPRSRRVEGEENAPAPSEREKKRVRTTWRFQPRSHRRAEDEENAPASSAEEKNL